MKYFTVTFSEEQIKLLIAALYQYRRKIQPANPKAVMALNIIDLLKDKLNKFVD